MRAIGGVFEVTVAIGKCKRGRTEKGRLQLDDGARLNCCVRKERIRGVKNKQRLAA